MKPAGYCLIALTLAGVLAAEPSPPAPKLSARLAREIRASLPPFIAPANPPPTGEAADSTDPDVLVLPKFMVKEKRIPTSDPDVWLNDRVVQQKAMAAYKGSMSPLEWALNSWFVPLFSAPPSVRARAAYEGNKQAAEYSQLAHLAEVSKLADPKAAAQLQKAVADMRHADDWQSRPAGN